MPDEDDVLEAAEMGDLPTIVKFLIAGGDVNIGDDCSVWFEHICV